MHCNIRRKINHDKREFKCLSDYINATITDFVELHGDRCFADDHAIVGGIGRLNGKPVTVIGIEKGRDLNERLLRNFGCVLPEGYRKALRLIK